MDSSQLEYKEIKKEELNMLNSSTIRLMQIADQISDRIQGGRQFSKYRINSEGIVDVKAKKKRGKKRLKDGWTEEDISFIDDEEVDPKREKKKGELNEDKLDGFFIFSGDLEYLQAQRDSLFLIDPASDAGMNGSKHKKSSTSKKRKKTTTKKSKKPKVKLSKIPEEKPHQNKSQSNQNQTPNFKMNQNDKTLAEFSHQLNQKRSHQEFRENNLPAIQMTALDTNPASIQAQYRMMSQMNLANRNNAFKYQTMNYPNPQINMNMGVNYKEVYDGNYLPRLMPQIGNVYQPQLEGPVPRALEMGKQGNWRMEMLAKKIEQSVAQQQAMNGQRMVREQQGFDSGDKLV